MLTFSHPEVVKKFLRLNGLDKFAPTSVFLKKLALAFQKMPYENMTKLIRARTHNSDLPARLRLPEILYEEHLEFGTGGTCFSMTYFMQTILRSCDFSTYPIMADRPLAPDTHCASVVLLDGKHLLIDPGFMIDEPLELTKIPTRYELRHTTILIGAKNTDLPEDSYVLSTIMGNKSTIRYYLKDRPVPADEFLNFWLDSFNWPTLRNISITSKADNGYIYARNNFIRTTTREKKSQERIKNALELTLGKTFHIDARIIRSAFEALREIKKG